VYFTAVVGNPDTLRGNQWVFIMGLTIVKKRRVNSKLDFLY